METRIYWPYWVAIAIAALVVIVGLLMVVVGALDLHDARRRPSGVTVRGRINGINAIRAAQTLRRQGLGVIVAALVGLLLFTWPTFSMRYHQYRKVAGTVASVNVRMLGAGHSTSQVYAVQIAGAGVYRCDDTRCSLLKPGDTVALWCKGDYQWFGTSGDVCAFGKSTESDG